MQPENTTRRQEAILDSLAQGATRTDAAHAAGISRHTLYTWMDQDSSFQEAVEDAEAETVDIVQGLAFRCAMHAQQDPRYLRALFFYLKCKAGWNDRPQRQSTVTPDLVKEVASEVIHTLQALGLISPTRTHPEPATEPQSPEPAEKHVQSVQCVQSPAKPAPAPAGAQRAAPSTSNAAPTRTAEQPTTDHQQPTKDVQSVQSDSSPASAPIRAAHQKPETKNRQLMGG